MSIIATIAAVAVPVGAWIASSRLEKTVPLPSVTPSAAPDNTPTPTPPQACMDPAYFSPELLPMAPIFDNMGAPAKEMLDGVQGFYLTQSGQEALAGYILQGIILTPNAAYRGNRSVIVREALAKLFPNCDWDRPMGQYTAEQYTAWLSAWPMSAAIEAEQGLALDVGPPAGTVFIPRAAVGLAPSAGNLADFPPGTYVRLLSSNEDGDDGTWVDATVSGVGAVAQEVIVEVAGPVAQSLGITAGSKHIVDVPAHAMAILQQTQPNPRQPNPFVIGQAPRQPMFSPRMGR